MEVDFSELNALSRQIRALGNLQHAEAEALDAGAEYIKKEFEGAAPVGATGKLRDNILKSEMKDGKIDIGTRPTGDGFYGFFIEFGTSKMMARPWARPTWERKKRNVKDIMAEELRKGMRL